MTMKLQIKAFKGLGNPCPYRSSRSLFVLLQLVFILAVFMLFMRDALIKAPKGQVDDANRAQLAITTKQLPASQREPTSISKLVKTGNPSIDMENDYYPFVDFKFKYPEIQPKLDGLKDYYLVVLVNSGATGDKIRQRRTKIRQTWASRTTCECEQVMNDRQVKNLKWILVFVLGKAGEQEDRRNVEEAKMHNDMIIGDIEDNYLNNILKFYMGQLWASMHGARYTLKTDDDVYIRIPKVMQLLVSEGSPSRLYGGETYRRTVVMRSVGQRWSISKKYFPEKVYPPFNAGAFILLSTDLLGELINYVHVRKPFHTDDAYIGVAMRDLKVNVVNILSFVIENNMSSLVHVKNDCYILNVLAYGHAVGLGAMEHIHMRLEGLCHGNASLETMKCPAKYT